jgi:hypothetical protein
MFLPAVASVGEDQPLVVDLIREVTGPGAQDETREVLNCDLVGLVEWTMGYPPAGFESGTSWASYVPLAGLAGIGSLPYVDRILEAALQGVIGSGFSGFRPTVLVTGDTDASTESDILNYLAAVEDSGAWATLLLWNPEQLTRRVVRRLKMGHSVGIHPFARSGSDEEYELSVRNLSRCVREATGGDPVACRNHKFQWHEAATQRGYLRNEGVKADLNLVAADGKSWIGTPTGLGVPGLDVDDESNAGLWVIPTHLEDEVFLYDLDYCYGNSRDRRAGDPMGVVRDFLELWVLGEGKVACVNLHPEHIDGEYGRILRCVLDWGVANTVAMPNLDTFVEGLGTGAWRACVD